MAAVSESDDASEIFWPGYVDAVTNLAINLLFVIAVMALVVLTATLQISKMKPKDANSDTTKIVSEASKGSSQEAANAVAGPLEKTVKEVRSQLQKATDAQDTLAKASPGTAPNVSEHKQVQQELGQLNATARVAQRDAKKAESAGGAQGKSQAQRALRDLQSALKKAQQLVQQQGQNDALQATPEQRQLQQRIEQALQEAQDALTESLRSSAKPTADSSAESQKTIEQQARTIEQLQKQVAKLQAEAPAKPAKSQSKTTTPLDKEAGPTENNNANAEVVEAQQRTQNTPIGGSQLQDLTSGGVVVAFAPEVIDLTDSESAELVKKLSATAPIKGSRWQLRVISPKGFSESARIAYYRLTSVRNLLIKQGVAPSDIEMRVVEAQSASANNSRVLVRLMP